MDWFETIIMMLVGYFVVAGIIKMFKWTKEKIKDKEYKDVGLGLIVLIVFCAAIFYGPIGYYN